MNKNHNSPVNNVNSELTNNNNLKKTGNNTNLQNRLKNDYDILDKEKKPNYLKTIIDAKTKREEKMRMIVPPLAMLRFLLGLMTATCPGSSGIQSSGTGRSERTNRINPSASSEATAFEAIANCQS